MRPALTRLLARLGEALYRLARRLDPDSPPWPQLPEISYLRAGKNNAHPD